ncbi:type I-E CRISPR-associated protein Cas7/Cse4/CasC [Actinoplanes sp. NBRC 101535]|uniref:type I-E CRISPR-associated protein Cas7/Cse4/CasC n=1 Tax=Actinoplanes sp. NBRC 101535 TaxID=3032196 RepID=UPI0024A4036F|nr:type I-E CRISPR-associated protein Cas7/Cse4/CasC [Actinoplanes sp. NBRC 101535]GLY03973.1 type I-E CRISPR-associated protein Cas7/Cse4/CasC [Actinoplanes sp. NBRC 101535]
MNQPLYVDVHIIQSLPPSNVNRDDAGSPKQAVYGGARRARVSSQAWKRATRKAFADRLGLPDEKLGTRTKRIGRELGERIAARTGLSAEDSRRLSVAMLGQLGLTASKKKAEESSYLLFYGHHQLDRIVDLVADRAMELVALPDDALDKAVADKNLAILPILASGHPIDVALFGRMVADLPSLNVDAATQVAHAISTHAAEIEFDYYTAVDDANHDDNGAGMIGTVEFTSATLYRFATVGVHQLVENLDGDQDAAQAALTAFLEAFAYSVPSGHQNSFAHQALPQLMSVAVRRDQPVNLVSAFEKPVYSRTGQAAESIKRLDKELLRAAETWGINPVAVASVYHQDVLPEPEKLGPAFTFSGLLTAVQETVSAQWAGPR